MKVRPLLIEAKNFEGFSFDYFFLIVLDESLFVLKIKLESVLSGGHDSWVQSLRWHPQKMQLLSSSKDKNVIVWEPINSESIWIPKVS